MYEMKCSTLFTEKVVQFVAGEKVEEKEKEKRKEKSQKSKNTHKNKTTKLPGFPWYKTFIDRDIKHLSTVIYQP